MKFTKPLQLAGIGLVGMAGAVGVAGLAGASTTQPATTKQATGVHAKGHHHALRRAVKVAKVEAIANANALPASYSCTRAVTDQAHITKAESWLDARLAKLQTAEQKAQTNGRTALVTVLDSWIQKGTTLRTDLGTVSGLITAKCG